MTELYKNSTFQRGIKLIMNISSYFLKVTVYDLSLKKNSITDLEKQARKVTYTTHTAKKDITLGLFTQTNTGLFNFLTNLYRHHHLKP